MQNFLLNGRKYYTKLPVTLFDLICYFNYKNNLFVIEYNYQIWHRQKWETTIIQKNDTIELITIVGGG